MPLHDLLLDTARTAPDRPALVAATGETVGYGLLAERTAAVAAALRARGFGPGDRLALWAPNVPPWAGVALGAMAAGGAVVPIGPAATAQEVAQAVATADPALLVTLPGMAAAARSAVTIPVLEVGPELLQAAPSDLPAVPDEAPALLPFSSGTTGLPKAVVLTHANLIASVRALQPRMRLRAGDVVLALAPFAHVMGSVVTLAAPLAAGATVVTMPRFEPDAFLEAIVRQRVTILTVPPPVMQLLAHHPRADLAGVEVVACGGAPLAPAVQEAVARRFPHVTIGQGYGMTETAVLISAPDRARGTVPGTVGPPAPGTEVRFVAGELQVRGPQVMTGYFREPERTREILAADGWLRTGDLGHLDGDGNLVITGRAKELIKVSGYQVAPAELEAVLARHPAVADAAVMGVEDEARGEALVALVVARGELDADALRAWFDAQVAGYKRLRELHVVDALPRTPAGKLLRRLLEVPVAV